MSIVRHLIDAAKGKHPIGTARSGHWASVRAEHLKQYPECAVCGGIEKLEVHHKQPFHLNPALELDSANLITLCEANKGGVNCHLFVGHLGNFRSFNPAVADDADTWRRKMQSRPLSLTNSVKENT
jgi:hypothetical protein